jgi:NAD(P)-dependent dehydrogenase (short-subunit alcohol dehydrogenase family)
MKPSRAALVAGGSGGVGLEIARTLGSEGQAVTIVGRRTDKLQRAAEALGEDGIDAQPVSADLAHEEEIRRAVAVHRERFGRLDTLVNSAGYGGPRGPLEDMDPRQLDLVLDVDLRATVLMTRECVPMLRDAGAEHGNALVVNVSSVAGSIGLGSIAAYSAAKGGTIAFGRAMREELGASGVQVTTLVPGYVDTPMSDWVDVPRDEMITPADLAEAVRLLLRVSPACLITMTRDGRSAQRWAFGAVGALTVAAFVLRAAGLDQSLFGDELFAHDEVHGRSLTSTITAVRTGYEVTPPLYFVLSHDRSGGARC